MTFGGSLNFISEWGKGSTFIFTFDIEVDEDEQQVQKVTKEISPLLPRMKSFGDKDDDDEIKIQNT